MLYKYNRNLQVTDMVVEYQIIIKRIVDSTYTYFKTNLNLKDTGFKLIQDQIGLFSIIKWTNQKESYNQYLNYVNNKLNVTVIDVSDLMEQHNNASYTVFNMQVDPALLAQTKIITIQSFGNFFSIIDNSNKEEITQSLPSLNPKLYIPLSDKYYSERFKYYGDRDINIYNANDPAFTQNCYFNRKLDYDIPLNLMKFSVYSNWTIMPSTGCQFIGHNKTDKKIILQCSISSDVSYTFSQYKFLNKTNGTEHSSLLCGGYIDKIENNFGFWTFLVMLIISIITTIILVIVDHSECFISRIDKWMIQDELIILNSNQNQSCSQIQIVKNVDDIQVYTQNNKKNISINVYCLNFLTLHPLLTLLSESIVCPLTFKIAVVTFNILNLFGFNALLYSNAMIEKKIFELDRNNFAYPMKNEFSKIILSILISMALSMLIRAIAILTHNDKELLSKSLFDASTQEDKYRICKDYWRKTFYRKLISYILMLGLIVFLFYYSVVFCGIFVNTQYGWFYSGIWSLLLNWCVFAPVSILIISAIDSSECTPICSYYAKQLFWF